MLNRQCKKENQSGKFLKEKPTKIKFKWPGKTWFIYLDKESPPMITSICSYYPST